MKTVHILTFHNALNYGAVLQCVALYKTIHSITECDVINYQSHGISKMYKTFSRELSIKNNIKGLILAKRTNWKRKTFNEFLKKNINLSKLYSNLNELSNQPWNENDIFCVGSDQVWNLDLIEQDSAYFLSFVPENVVKMSYAASIGKELSDAEITYFQNKLKKFRSISVRETSIQNRLTDIGITCIQNIDPVYLLKKEEWENISTTVPEEDRNYVLIYLLQKSKNFVKKAIDYAEFHQKRIVIISTTVQHKRPGAIYLDNCTPAEFIRYFMKADTIFTNSYHGMAFSIIFNKYFFFEFLENKKKFKTNSRLKDIVKLFNLEKQNSAKYKKVPNDLEIRYDYINEIIEKERTRSLQYLEEAIRINV